MDASSSGSIPATLGRYRVLRRLGAGGMAEVFLARSSGAEGIEKTLVVKRVLPSIAKRPRFISMFVDEAKLATRLNHPNIVQVYAFEQVRGEFLLAMEYVDGADLSRLLARGREQGVAMPPELAAWIVAEAAKGLDYAHRRTDEAGQPMDIVHRDISPQNILLGYEGVVKIADFGIARARSFAPQAGVIQGKFAYMSPEQARGSEVDHRSDVYGLGAVLTELLAGRPLFERGERVLERVREGNVPAPRDLNPAAPEPLDAIARRAMAAEPEARFASAREMLRALSEYLHAQSAPVDPTTLEAWLDEVMPSELRRAENESGRGLPPVPSPALPDVLSPHEARERRAVLVLVGQLLRADAVDVAAAEVAARILDDIAFKAEAVLGWEDDAESLDRRRFRLVLGLGESGVSEPLRAVRLSLDVMDALRSLADGDDSPLVSGLGLSRGSASVQRDEEGRLLRYQPEDDAFVLAAALSRAARPDEVLVSSEVYRLTRREFAFDDARIREVALVLGEEDITPQAVRALPLLGARGYDQRVAQGGLSGLSQSKLVGREALVAHLERSVFEALRDRAQRALRLTGPLGVGKTAVILASLERLGNAARCLHVECGYGSARDALSTLRQLLLLALGYEPGRAPSRVQAASRAVLGAADTDGALSAHAAQLLEGGLVETDAPNLELTTRTVAALLRASSVDRPLLVCVDALQWADEASLRVLSALATRSQPTPLVFWLSGRPEPLVDRVMSSVRNHPVEELSQADARILLGQCLDLAEVPPALAHGVLSRAGGNPLFVVEIVEAMQERGDLRFGQDANGARVIEQLREPRGLPGALEAVVSDRLSQLDQASLGTLRWLAVAGAPIDEVTLAQLTGDSHGDAVTDLSARGLLRRDPRGRLVFVNPVLRQVALDGLDLRDRASMQRRVDSELLNVRPYLRSVVRAREQEAQGLGRRASRGFAEAATLARQAGELADALRYLARGLTLLPEGDPERVDLHRTRIELLRATGRADGLRDEIDRLERLAEITGLTRARGWAFALRGEHAIETRDVPRGRHCLQVARAVETAARDATLSGWVALLEARLAWASGDRVPAESMLARLSGSFEPLAPTLVAQTRLLECTIAEQDHDWSRLHRASLKAVGAAAQAGDPGAQARGAEALALACQFDGALEDALWLLRGGQAQARDAGVAAGAARRLTLLGGLLGDLGDAEASRSHLARAAEVALELEETELAAQAHVEQLRMELHVAAEPERAEGALAKLSGLPSAAPSLLSLCRGHLAAALGHWAVAEPSLRDALALDPALASPTVHAELSMARGAAGDVASQRAHALSAFGLLTERPSPRGLERDHLRVQRALHHARMFELRDRIGQRAEQRIVQCAGQFRDGQLREGYLARWRVPEEVSS